MSTQPIYYLQAMIEACLERAVEFLEEYVG
jgi:hypothetical protein